MEFFCTCPTGFEALLASELGTLRIPRIRPLQGMVSFEGTLRDAYTACMHTRLASRVVAVLARGDAHTADELYETAHTVAWHDHIAPHASFMVDATGTNAQIRNTQFAALKVKDSIADALRAQTGAQPVSNPKNPDLTVVARVARDRVTLGIDLAGTPLFRRGYERFGSTAALRPDYAAALLMLAGWPLGTPSSEADAVPLFIDASPIASSLLVEAAASAAGRAAGLLRLKWGFMGWAQHDEQAWEEVVRSAEERASSTVPATLMVPHGTKGITAARAAIRAAGLEAPVTVAHDSEWTGTQGETVVGCDLSALFAEDLVREAHALQNMTCVARSSAARCCAVIARDELFSSFAGHEPEKRVLGKLGRQDAFLSSYLRDQSAWNATAQIDLGQGGQAPILVPASDQFAARLKKVARLRDKWARRTDVTCYRVYDADLPDYAVAIDLYQGTDPTSGMPNGERWLQVAEYAAPKSVDPLLARSRLVDVLTLAPTLLEVDPHNTYLHIRRHGKGGSQYSEEAQRGQRHRRPAAGRSEVPLPPGAHLVDEGGLTFEVNFTLRHDCGIFLDHRETRAFIREKAKQTKGSKRFLNLFAYTGTATCYAADGGARHTTTVDLSRPSLDWARRNMERNGFVGRDHEYVQADVLAWVTEQRHTRNRWDLIFCDVPTFSNSSRMRKRSFDVQRDHTELLIGVSRLLTRDGSCVFSCNLRSFSPDLEKLRRAGVVLEDITQQTIPEDFARNARIHHTYVMHRVAVTC